MTFDSIPQLLIVVLWLAWLLYWIGTAIGVKPNRWREPLWFGAIHRAPVILAALLLATPGWCPRVLTERFLPPNDISPIAGVLLAGAGLGFSVWARRHLGRNWSANVTLKEGHVLIRSGPYRYVRHPIYTGVLLAFLGTALTMGEWRGLAAFVLACVAFVLKSRWEESRLRLTFPEYDDYREHTAALVPCVY